jgi:hypothetical protein
MLTFPVRHCVFNFTDSSIRPHAVAIKGHIILDIASGTPKYSSKPGAARSATQTNGPTENDLPFCLHVFVTTVQIHILRHESQPEIISGYEQPHASEAQLKVTSVSISLEICGTSLLGRDIYL